MHEITIELRTPKTYYIKDKPSRPVGMVVEVNCNGSYPYVKLTYGEFSDGSQQVTLNAAYDTIVEAALIWDTFNRFSRDKHRFMAFIFPKFREWVIDGDTCAVLDNQDMLTVWDYISGDEIEKTAGFPVLAFPEDQETSEYHEYHGLTRAELIDLYNRKINKVMELFPPRVPE